MITTLLIIIVATIIGLGIATLMVPGLNAKDKTAFVIAATVLALINTFIRPVLWFLTAPLSMLSFGLFALIINAFMIMLTAALVPGFEVKGFFSAFLAALIMAVIGALAFLLFPLLTGADISWQTYEYHSMTP